MIQHQAREQSVFGQSEGELAECRAYLQGPDFNRDSVFVFPTETLYALGCYSSSQAGIAAVYEAKQRPANLALPLLVDSWQSFIALCPNLHPAAQHFLQHLWPAALTAIVKAEHPNRDLLNRGGGDTLAIRWSLSGVACMLAKTAATPIIGTSANLSGAPVACSLDELPPEIVRRCSFLIDGGRLENRLASTIVDFQHDHNWKILREESLSRSFLLQTLKNLQSAPATAELFADIRL